MHSDSESPQPLVTVVLPVYNGQRTLAAAVASIQAQTFTDWDMVIFDDGSTDASLELCNRLAETDGRIRVVSGGANRGLGAAMNRLMLESRGDLIAVQEQDDVSEPHRFELQVAAFAADDKVGLVSGIAQWMSNGEPSSTFPGLLARGLSYPEDMVSYLLVEQCKVVNACVMFRRRCLQADQTPFDDEARMSVDWQFFIDLAHRERFVGLNEILVRVDRSPSRHSLTANKKLQKHEARRCLRIVRRRYLHDPDSPLSYALLRKAWATELNLEGRWKGGLVGLSVIAFAWSLDPKRPELQESLKSTIEKGLNKARRVIGLAARA